MARKQREEPDEPDEPRLWDSPVKGAWVLMRARPKLWVILAIPGVAGALAQVTQQYSYGQEAMVPAVCLQQLLLPLTVISVLCGLATMSGMAHEVVDHPVAGVSEAFKRVWKRMGEVVGLGCLTVVAAIPFVIVLVASAQNPLIERFLSSARGSGQPSPWIVVVIGTLSIIVATRLGFAYQAVLLTDLGVRGVVAHTWRLSNRRALRLAPYYLLAFAPGWIPWLVSNAGRSLGLGAGATAGAGLLIAPLAAAWSIFATAMLLLLWYRTRTQVEKLTPVLAAREMGIPK